MQHGGGFWGVVGGGWAARIEPGGFSLSPGDPEAVESRSYYFNLHSVLCSMVVAFEESWESLELEDHSSLSLTKMANDVTYRRLLRSLERISSMGSQLLANILLGIRQRRLLLPPSREFVLNTVISDPDSAIKVYRYSIVKKNSKS